MGEGRFIEYSGADYGTLLDQVPSITWVTRGVSMRPLIVSGRDYVTVEKARGPLAPYDVALYRQTGQGKTRYALHRVIGLEDGAYRILGDNCLNVEIVPREDVVGVMTHLIRKGKEVDLEGRPYRAYARAWTALYPLRRIYMKARGMAARLLGRKKGGERQTT